SAIMKKFSRASSSVGQSWRLITAWSRVQVLAGPPTQTAHRRTISAVRRFLLGGKVIGGRVQARGREIRTKTGGSLVPDGFQRADLDGPVGRGDAGQDADAGGEGQRGQDQPGGDLGHGAAGGHAPVHQKAQV